MVEKKNNVYTEIAFGSEYDYRESQNWLLSQVQGTHILDVGCSNGYTSIQLGREYKKVLGIDTSSLAINEALIRLKDEDEDTRNNVMFEKSNFFKREFNNKFDTILLGGILEQIADFDTFCHKAFSLLNEKGRVIVTTPFGLNDSSEFKRTFYIHEFLKIQQPLISITEIEYKGSWIGVIFQKTETISSQKTLDLPFLKQLEQAFLRKEQMTLAKTQRKTQGVSDDEDVYKKFLDEKIIKVKTQQELYEQYKKEKEILNAYNKLKKEHEKILKSYKHLKNQVDRIKKTFIGKVAFKLWRMLKGKR
ncbi:class I SAM-dependent methyltransferase [Metabacillus litoralis]|uniref:class I SAM-dependent methyltransferase n=1 Tax=Metabacillus litoralis TaxID=152268 RepID=UPI001CFD9314|nr:class I SAM-dependent methyltransferase [Metabacillus litoralis]